MQRQGYQLMLTDTLCQTNPNPRIKVNEYFGIKNFIWRKVQKNVGAAVTYSTFILFELFYFHII